MFHFILTTLFDLTPTGVLSFNAQSHNIKQRNQQRNWQVVSQLIQMRTQPVIMLDPVSVTTKLSHLNFGSNYCGQQRIWVAHWAVEQTELYGPDSDPFEILHIDFNQIPLLTDLDETAKIPSPVLVTKGDMTNICFYTQKTWPQEVIAIDFELDKNN